MKKRVSFYEIAKEKNSVRLFNKKIYFIKGMIAVEDGTGDLKKLTDIYYHIRTVKNEKGFVTAKRKKQTDELLTI